MSALTFHPQFKRDVAAAARRYDEEQAGLGDRFRDEVFAALAQIQTFPFSGAKIDTEVRHLVLRHFPYHLLYVVDQEALFILSMAHQHRRPGHWQRRMR